MRKTEHRTKKAREMKLLLLYPNTFTRRSLSCNDELPLQYHLFSFKFAQSHPNIIFLSKKKKLLIWVITVKNIISKNFCAVDMDDDEHKTNECEREKKTVVIETKKCLSGWYLGVGGKC
jgi:hypothetical protein